MASRGFSEQFAGELPRGYRAAGGAARRAPGARIPQGFRRPGFRAWRPLLPDRLEIEPPRRPRRRLSAAGARAGDGRASLRFAVPALRGGAAPAISRPACRATTTSAISAAFSTSSCAVSSRARQPAFSSRRPPPRPLRGAAPAGPWSPRSTTQSRERRILCDDPWSGTVVHGTVASIVTPAKAGAQSSVPLPGSGWRLDPRLRGDD